MLLLGYIFIAIVVVILAIYITIVLKPIKEEARANDDNERLVNFRSSVQERQDRDESLVGIEEETGVDFRRDREAYRILREYVTFADAVEILNASGLSAEEVLDAENGYESLSLDAFNEIVDNLRVGFSDADILKGVITADFSIYDDYSEIIFAARTRISISDIVRVISEDRAANMNMIISELIDMQKSPELDDIVWALINESRKEKKE